MKFTNEVIPAKLLMPRSEGKALTAALRAVNKANPEQDFVNYVVVNNLYGINTAMKRQRFTRRVFIVALGAVFTISVLNEAEIIQLKEEIRKLKEAQKES